MSKRVDHVYQSPRASRRFGARLIAYTARSLQVLSLVVYLGFPPEPLVRATASLVG
jgi:hypothetical protein